MEHSAREMQFRLGSQRRGHNLLEMLVATMIFVTVMISIASVYQYIATETARNRERLVGQYLARGLMEKCVAARYTNVVELASTGTLVDATPAVYPPVQMIYRKDGQVITTVFYSEVRVDESADPVFTVGNTSARIVTVRVSWEDKNRRTAGSRPYAEYRTFIGENS